MTTSTERIPKRGTPDFAEIADTERPVGPKTRVFRVIRGSMIWRDNGGGNFLACSVCRRLRAARRHANHPFLTKSVSAWTRQKSQDATARAPALLVAGCQRPLSISFAQS